MRSDDMCHQSIRTAFVLCFKSERHGSGYNRSGPAACDEKYSDYERKKSYRKRPQGTTIHPAHVFLILPSISSVVSATRSMEIRAAHPDKQT